MVADLQVDVFLWSQSSAAACVSEALERMIGSGERTKQLSVNHPIKNLPVVKGRMKIYFAWPLFPEAERDWIRSTMKKIQSFDARHGTQNLRSSSLMS